MAITRATNVSALANNAIAASVLTVREGTIMLPLVWNHTLPQGINQKDIPTWSQASVASSTDGVEIQDGQSFTPSSTTFTASEAGALILVTDNAMEDSQDDVGRLAGEELGGAMAAYYDSQLMGNFDSFSTNALGSAGTELSVPYVFAAHALLHGNSTQRVPRFGKVSGVLHTFQYTELEETIGWPAVSNLASVPPDIQRQALKSAYVTTIRGIKLFGSNVLSVDGSDDAKGAIFHERALVVVHQRKPRIEKERNPRLRGWEIVATQRFGHGINQNEWAVEMYFDAATPSGTTI